jgi:hypothetical protein
MFAEAGQFVAGVVYAGEGGLEVLWAVGGDQLLPLWINRSMLTAC